MKNFWRLICVSPLLLGSLPLLAQKTQYQWQFVSTIPEDSLVRGQLYFADSLHGYFLGSMKPPSDGSNISTKQWVFYHTANGAASWQKIDFRSVFGADTLMYNNSSNSYAFFNPHFKIVPGTGTCVFSNMEGLGNTLLNEDTTKFYWSENYGTTWGTHQTIPLTKRGDFEFDALPHDYQVIALRTAEDGNRVNFGKFSFSDTYGIDLSTDLRWDSLLINTIAPDSQSGGNSMDGSQSFGMFDDLTWFLTKLDYEDPTKPFSLLTLVSHDAGHSWQIYHNLIPYVPSGDLGLYFDNIQCLRSTSYAYMSLSAVGANGFPLYEVNYIYSSDYGQTWNVDTSFHRNRKAYTAAMPGEVWCTITPHDSVTADIPAHWIVHTTDKGQTWDIDSSSLYNDGFYDGININFSDQRHGWIAAKQPGVVKNNIAIFKYFPPAKNEVKPDASNNALPTFYPNPANEEMTIQTNATVQIKSLEFFDILGRKWSCPYEIQGNQTALIHTGGLQSGSYVAHVILQGGNEMIRFMVQH